MFKKIGFTALVLFSSLAMAQTPARAADRDDFRRGYRDEPRVERRVVRDHDRRDGYFDRFGCWHSYGFRR